MRAPALSFTCAESWDSMPGDDRVRHCSRCDTDVHNLSVLTFAEALAVVVRRGPTCVRFERDGSGGLRLAARAAVAAVALTTAAHAESWTVGPAASEAALPASSSPRTLVVSKETGQHAPGVPVTLVGADGPSSPWRRTGTARRSSRRCLEAPTPSGSTCPTLSRGWSTWGRSASTSCFSGRGRPRGIR